MMTKEGRLTQIVAVGNQKGGVGKTTNTVHLATALGEMGRRCLIIDLDANSGATRHFGIPATGFMGTFELLLGDEDPEDLALTNGDSDIVLPNNVDIIPCRRKIEDIDDALASKFGKFHVKQKVLIAPLETLRGKYDYVFLDTAPQATTPTVAAYMATDWFILSALPEHFAIQGLQDALQDINDARQNRDADHPLRLLGVIVSGVDRRTSLSNRLTEYVEKLFAVDDKVSAKFTTVISHSTVIPQAQELGKTVFQTVPRHRVTEQFREVAREIEERAKPFVVPLESEAPGDAREVADEQPVTANG